ncbi:hypothetical protein SAMN05192561_11241 [Halopenitus malekzadehii]|uniref:Uncharacterized protein n=1 Tax=Halopenitus malekzadehii TaxID=1267564 RepID=A0A1H6JJ14_9EURY|nr:hypothetical protein [Halopenitus malekzadehii]SEH60811.1 hypothetical protein SAMN05192561_11241 [Halopenitus malekzadehii]
MGSPLETRDGLPGFIAIFGDQTVSTPDSRPAFFGQTEITAGGKQWMTGRSVRLAEVI